MIKRVLILFAFFIFSYKIQAQNLTTKDIEQLEKKAKQAVQGFVNSVRGYEYSIEVNQFESKLIQSSDLKRIAIGANLQYRIDHQIYVGGLFNYEQQSLANLNYSNISIYGLGTYYFQNDVLSSLYCQLGIGIYNSSEVDSLQAAFLMGLGKQYQIFERITLSPHLQISKKGKNNSEFEIYPLSTSVWF